MICAEFERTKEGWKVRCRNGVDMEIADMIEAFKMENIDIIGVLENMKVSETKVYNIGWWNGCGIAKRGIKSKIVEFR